MWLYTNIQYMVIERILSLLVLGVFFVLFCFFFSFRSDTSHRKTSHWPNEIKCLRNKTVVSSTVF